MKKMLLGILFLFPLYGTTHAQTKQEDVFLNSCYSDALGDFSEADKKNCNANRNTELLSPRLKLEVDAFQENVLNKLYRDHGSNPNYIAKKGILEIRKYKNCLQKICYKIFSECSKEDLSSSFTIKSQHWCGDAVEKLDLVARSELAYAASINQSRKEHSLEKQKLNALETRFRSYLTHWMVDRVIPSLKFFIFKTPIFIMYPT